jgi:hypothetical protein
MFMIVVAVSMQLAFEECSRCGVMFVSCDLDWQQRQGHVPRKDCRRCCRGLFSCLVNMLLQCCCMCSCRARHVRYTCVYLGKCWQTVPASQQLIAAAREEVDYCVLR